MAREFRGRTRRSFQPRCLGSAGSEPASRVFSSKGEGAEMPISIHGTKSEPKVGLDLFGHRSDPGWAASTTLPMLAGLYA